MKVFIFLSFLFLVSCGKNTDYVHLTNPPARQFFANTFSIQDIDSSNKIDILWVVDNSGSMNDIQRNIVVNAELFMSEFIKSNYIDWKMGLVSTDNSEAPYLGFATVFNRNTANPVELFKTSVGSLGTNGSGSEYVFQNIDRNFLLYPSFRRSDAHLAIIMVTDEVEQSATDIDRIKYEPNYFFNYLKSSVGPRFKLRMYGAFNARELENCENYAMIYNNSPFQKVIDLSEGFAMSACKPDFGTGLSSIGKDIASLLQFPRLLLSERPRVETIKVLYKGVELIPGRPETGGYWYYDDEFNLIVFYNLNFSQDFEFDSVDVKFEINDGVVRE
jgi:hypothetical protein